MNTHDKYELPPPTELFFHSNGDGEPVRVRGYTSEQVIAAIEADRKRRGEPVAWVKQDIAENQFINMRPRRIWWECNEGIGMPIYTNPQPAEPEGELDITTDEQGNVVTVMRRDKEGRVLGAVFESVPEPAEPVKVPSDAEIMAEVYAVCPDFDSAHEGIDEYQVVSAFRALLARYGKPAQPTPEPPSSD